MTVEELMKLPGVGRKTANVITSVIDKQPNMAVDTHVFRVAARIGLTINAKTPLATEKQLIEFIPKDLVHKRITGSFYMAGTFAWQEIPNVMNVVETGL
jgi:endonuclease-3